MSTMIYTDYTDYNGISFSIDVFLCFSLHFITTSQLFFQSITVMSIDYNAITFYNDIFIFHFISTLRRIQSITVIFIDYNVMSFSIDNFNRHRCDFSLITTPGCFYRTLFLDFPSIQRGIFYRQLVISVKIPS